MKECARSLEELRRLLEARGYEVHASSLSSILYVRRDGEGCIAEVATPWLRIYRRYSRDGDTWYVVELWFEALAEELGRWLPEG